MKLLCEVFPVFTHWHIKLRWQLDDWKGDRPVYKPICFITGITSEETANRIAAALRAEFGELPS